MKVMTYNCEPKGKSSGNTRAEMQLVVLEKAMSNPELFDFIGTQEECKRALHGTSKGDALAALNYTMTGDALKGYWGSPIIYNPFRWTKEESGNFMIANPYTGGHLDSYTGLSADTRPCNWGIYSKNLQPHTRDVNQGYTVLFVNCHFPHSGSWKRTLKAPSLMNQVTSQVEVATGVYWGKKNFDQMWMTGDMNEYGKNYAGNNTNGFPVKIFDKQLKQGNGANELQTLGKKPADRVYYWAAGALKEEPTAKLADTSNASDHKPVKLNLKFR